MSTHVTFTFPSLYRRAFCAAAFAVAAFPAIAAESSLQDLQEQNRALSAQLAAQQRQLDTLTAQIDKLSKSREATPTHSDDEGRPSLRDSATRKLVISGEVGLAFFGATNDGQYRNDEFRVDDAYLRMEAPVAKDTYFFGELQLARREGLDEDFYLGEFYVDFENVSGALGGPERLVNVRFGRVDIPFGEEYLHRDPLENPLVTHSLSDVWGTDEGIEVYGELGRATYAFAVQNGSSLRMRDLNADKALTLRIGFDATSKLHLSASGYRSGELNSAHEPLSEIWIGNNVFRNIGSARSTTHEAELAELDATYTWASGHVWAAGGKAVYRDNDPLADNTRHFDYLQLEATQSLTRDIFGAVRLSTLSTDHGYPLTGIGQFNKYFLTALQTKKLQRISVGGGYRFSPSAILKFDYTIENAELTTGAGRDNQMISAEAALGF